MTAPDPSPPPAQPRAGGVNPLLRGALAVGLVTALAVVVLRRPGWILEALEAARVAGPWGRAVFAALYLVAALLMLPAAPITLAAGHAFGPLAGVLVAAPSSCLAACVPFLLGRTLLRGPAERQLARRRGLQALAGALRRSGLKVVALLRLSPLVPFPVLSYLVGATPVRLRDFAAGSFLGMLPSTVVYAWLGSLVPDGRQSLPGPPGGTGAWVVLALLVAVSVAAVLLARRALLRALAEGGQANLRYAPPMLRAVTPARLLLLAVALVLAVGAIPVGVAFALRPDGSLVGLPLPTLAGTPFPDFRIPGLVLAAVVGGSTLATAVLVARGSRLAPRLALVAGVLVVGWIAVQVSLLGYVSGLQPAVGLLGLAMIALARPAVRPSLEAEHEARLRAEFLAQPLAPAAPLEGAELDHLPPAVQRFIRRSGAVGRPKVQNVRFEFQAEMFRKPGTPALRSTTVQHNIFASPARLFFMRSRLFGLPVRVFHAYAREEATMVVRVASLVDMVNLAGDGLSGGETVTVLNDMCCFAPGTLVDRRLAWEPLDERRVKVTFQNGRRRVAAVLSFNERDELVDFVSDDRPALEPDGTLRQVRWSTPLEGHRELDGRWLPTRGVAIYHYPEGAFTYGIFVLTAIEYDVATPRARYGLLS